MRALARAFFLIGVATAVHAAAQRGVAAQRTPTAHCYDGTYYYGPRGSQACAHHRGVSEWLAKPSPRPPARHPAAKGRRAPAPRPAARKPPARRREVAPARATARCRDGTWAFDANRKSACTGHRGVARWLGQR